MCLLEKGARPRMMKSFISFFIFSENARFSTWYIPWVYLTLSWYFLCFKLTPYTLLQLKTFTPKVTQYNQIVFPQSLSIWKLNSFFPYRMLKSRFNLRIRSLFLALFLRCLLRWVNYSIANILKIMKSKLIMRQFNVFKNCSTLHFTVSSAFLVLDNNYNHSHCGTVGIAQIILQIYKDFAFVELSDRFHESRFVTFYFRNIVKYQGVVVLTDSSEKKPKS